MFVCKYLYRSYLTAVTAIKSVENANPYPHIIQTVIYLPDLMSIIAPLTTNKNGGDFVVRLPERSFIALPPSRMRERERPFSLIPFTDALYRDHRPIHLFDILFV